MKENLRINGWIGLLVGFGSIFDSAKNIFTFNTEDDREPLWIGSTGHAPNQPPPPSD